MLGPVLAAESVTGHTVSGGDFQPVTSTELLADAAILERAYGSLHPGLFRYQTAAQYAARVGELEAALRGTTSLAQAYLAFARFTASVRCGHSYPNYFNQPKAVMQTLFDGTNRVPFTFTWLHGHMIVTRNLTSESALAPGTDVLAIDGHAADTILTGLLPYTRADGSNDAKRIDELGVTGNARYEAFDMLYPLVYPSTSKMFTLRVKPFGSTDTREIRVEAQTAADRNALAAPSATSATKTTDSAPPALWTSMAISANVAYLKMPTWVTYNSKWDWNAFLNDEFATLARDHTPNLIIDLRGNEGGTDVGSVLAAHLIDRKLERDGVRELVRYRTIPSDLAPYLDTYDPSFKDWGAAAIPLDGRFFHLVRTSDGATDGISPQAPRYTGHVWVVVDAANSSATFNFAQLVQQHHLATLVGAPTGGNQRGINGGAFFFVHLPNTGIEVDLPLIGTFPTTPAPDAGLTPDILAERSIADIAAGRDSVLNVVVERLKPHP